MGAFDDLLPGDGAFDDLVPKRKKSGFGSDIARGVDQLQSTLYGLTALGGGALGVPAVEEWGMRGYQRNREEAAANAPEIGSYTNIGGVGDALTYAREAIGENVPMFIPSLLTGGVGGILARKAAERAALPLIERKVAEGVARNVAEKEAATMVGRRTTAGAVGGALPSTVGLNTGEIYGDIFEETGEKAPGTALGYGALAGALDVLPQAALLRRALVRPAATGSMLRRYGGDAAKQFAGESVTEGAQEVLGKAAVQAVDPTKDIFSPENTTQFIDAMLKGGIAGGGMSVGANVLSPTMSQHDRLLSQTADLVKKQHEQKTQLEVAAQEEAATPSATPAATPAPKSEPSGLEIADPKKIFDAITARPAIYDTIRQAQGALPEPAQETEKEGRAALDAAIKSLEADPQEIFRIRDEQPEIFKTITQMAGEFDAIGAERATYPREREALDALLGKGELTDEDRGFLTQSRYAKANGAALMPLPSGRRRSKELSTLAPKTVAGVAASVQTDEQLHAIAANPETPANTRHAAVATLQARVEQPAPISPSAPATAGAPPQEAPAPVQREPIAAPAVARTAVAPPIATPPAVVAAAPSQEGAEPAAAAPIGKEPVGRDGLRQADRDMATLRANAVEFTIQTEEESVGDDPIAAGDVVAAADRWAIEAGVNVGAFRRELHGRWVKSESKALRKLAPQLLGGVPPLQNENIRAYVKGFKGAIGRDAPGGRVIIDETTRNQVPGGGDVMGRTSHEGNPLWFGRPDPSFSAKQARKAIDRALEGKPLGVREQRFIDYVVAQAQAQDAEMAEAEALADTLDEQMPPQWGMMDEDEKESYVNRLLELSEEEALALGAEEGSRDPESALGQTREPGQDDERAVDAVASPAPALDLTGQTPEEIAAAHEQRVADQARKAADEANAAARERRAANKAEQDRRAAEVLAERNAAKKAEVDAAAADFQLGQEAPAPVVKKVSTEEAAGQGDVFAGPAQTAATQIAGALRTAADAIEGAASTNPEQQSPPPVPNKAVPSFPVMQSGGAPDLKIPWAIAEMAFSAYAKKYGRGQSLARIAERGGFAANEMDRYLPDWRQRVAAAEAAPAESTAAPAEQAALPLLAAVDKAKDPEPRPEQPKGDTDATLARTRPRQMIVFSKPYVGKTGAKLVGYEWKWRTEDIVDNRGEDRTIRVSDWEDAITNPETNRDIVHQFQIERTDGSVELVSAESAAKMLGVSQSTARASAKRLLAQEIENQRQRELGKNAADKLINGPWHPTPAAAIRALPGALSRIWSKHQNWGERLKTERNYDYYMREHSVEFAKGPNGYVALESAPRGEFNPGNIESIRLNPKEIWDANGNDLAAPAEQAAPSGEGGPSEEPPSNTALSRNATAPAQTQTPEFKRWFGESKVVDENGEPLRVYHGTKRLDRMGPRVNPRRATSGPMPFFTDAQVLASSYAIGKQDTSLAKEDVLNYEHWFRVKLPGSRNPVNIDRAWHSLPAEERARISALAPRVMRDDAGENIILGPEGETRGIGNYDYEIKQSRGNPLKALIEGWLSGGVLYNDEAEFLKVLKVAGMTTPVEMHDPWAEHPGVLPVYLAIQNPLRTGAITPETVAALEQAVKRTRPRMSDTGDIWDKDRQSPKEWVAQLQEDIAKGVHSYVWTSIPDRITAELKALGYDGIIDAGGKMGGPEHTVYIPFAPTQIKSAVGNRGTFDPNSSNIVLSRNATAPDLIIQHNITTANLLHAVRMGGIPVPSMAITKAADSMTNFGEITLIGDAAMADPKGYARTRVFGADIYSPRYPDVSYRLDKAGLAKLNDILAPYRQEGEREVYSGEVSNPDDLRGNKAFDKYAAEKFTDAHGVDSRAAGQALVREAGATEHLFRGFTYSGNRRYKAHTLENVVAILKKDMRGGEGFNYGMGSVRAKFTPQFRSVAQIRQEKGRLVSKANFEKVKEEVESDFFNLANDLKPFYQHEAESFRYSDTVMGLIEDSAKMGFMRAAKEYGFNDVSPEVRQQLFEFLTRLRNMPTEYFEAKILREVDLSEFAAAVVPEGVSKAALDALSSRGVKVSTYKKGDEADRKRVVAEAAQQTGRSVFSRSGIPGLGMKRDDVNAVANRFRKAYKGLPPIHVAQDLREAPAALRRDIKGLGGEHDTAGAWHDGEVWLFANNLHSPENASFVMLHELTHHGLRGMFGHDLDPVLLSIYELNSEVRKKTHDMMALNRQLSRVRATEEVLANMGGANIPETVWARLVAGVRKALRRLGFKIDLTDADIRDLVASALRHVKNPPSKTHFMSGTATHQAWHGSPHDFDEFSLHKIGTGEGAQAYGWGMYFSGKRDVAEHYRKQLSRGAEVTVHGTRLDDQHGMLAAHIHNLLDLVAAGETFGDAKEQVIGDLLYRIDYSRQRQLDDDEAEATAAQEAIDGYKSSDISLRSGRLYEVELAPKEDEYLDWDKPLSEQSAKVREAILSLMTPARLRHMKTWKQPGWARKSGEDPDIKFEDSIEASGLYRYITEDLGGQQAASEALSAAGVPGIRYLDGSSRNVTSIATIRANLAKAKANLQAWQSNKSDVGQSQRDMYAAEVAQLEQALADAVATKEHHNYVIFDDRLVSVKSKLSRQSTGTGEAAGTALSRQATAPDWVTNGSPALKSAASKVDTFAPQATIGDKVKALSVDWQKRLVQGLFDQFSPLKELSHKAYVMARMTKSADGALEGMLMYGKPKMDKDGAIIGDLDGKGFLGIMKELKGEHDRFFMWIAGNRAARLAGEDREHLFTPDEIDAMKELNRGKMSDGTSRESAYLKAFAEYRAYSKAVLDIAEKTGLIDGAARHLWEHAAYVPFYRVMDDDKISGPSKIKGLVRQQAFKKLKGGEENLGDLMGNTLRNWSHLLSASLANQAAVASLQAAEKVGAAAQVPADTKGATFAMVNGKQTHYEVADPFVLEAISAIEHAGFKGLPMQLMRKAKHYLTLGVTVSPTFRIRNLMRDTISAIGQNDISYNALNNLVEGFKGTNKKSDDYAQMLFGGGLMRFGTYLEGDRAENVKRLIDDGVDPDTILDNPRKVKAALAKVWDVWQDFGDRMENVNRAALYKQLIAQGKTHQEASFAARDMLDFSMQGSFTAVRFLTQIVPFLNARAQGLYRLGRAAKDDPKRLAYVAGTVALASIALLLAYDDDEEWKKREEWDRDSMWWFKLGDVAFRIPKPFEIGAIGTIAERSVELMINDEMTGKRFRERMLYMLGQTFAMNPVPQLFKPMVDIYANEDSFTGRQIETRGMENLSKANRANANTSLVARALGAAGGVTNISPIQVDHIIRGYFGWLGSHTVMTVDLMAQPFQATEKPTRTLGDMFVVGDFVKDLPAKQSRYVEDFYKQAKAVSEVMADIKRAREVGEIDKARELMEDNKDKVALHRLYSQAERRMGDINRQIRLTQGRSLSGDEKRVRLDQLMAMRNRLAETVSQRASAQRQQ